MNSKNPQYLQVFSFEKKTMIFTEIGCEKFIYKNQIKASGFYEKCCSSNGWNVNVSFYYRSKI